MQACCRNVSRFAGNVRWLSAVGHRRPYSSSLPVAGNGLNGDGPTLPLPPSVCRQWSRGMAGHSHWQNIRHTKQARDSQKAKISNRCVRMIRLAIQKGGGNNPESNMMLNRAIKYARHFEITVATIERTLKGNDKPLEYYTYELKGPENCFLIVETLTDNRKRTKADLRGCIKKIPLTTMLDGGTLGHVFSQKGIVAVEKTDGLTVEKALDHAIEAGAEDVREGEHESGKQVLEFVTDALALSNVTKRLEEMNYSVMSSDLVYLAQVKQKLSEDSLEFVGKLYEVIENVPEVVKIYDNIE